MKKILFLILVASGMACSAEVSENLFLNAIGDGAAELTLEILKLAKSSNIPLNINNAKMRVETSKEQVSQAIAVADYSVKTAQEGLDLKKKILQRLKDREHGLGTISLYLDLYQ